MGVKNSYLDTLKSKSQTQNNKPITAPVTSVSNSGQSYLNNLKTNAKPKLEQNIKVYNDALDYTQATLPNLKKTDGSDGGRLQMEFAPVAPVGAPVNTNNGTKLVNKNVYDAVIKERERQTTTDNLYRQMMNAKSDWENTEDISAGEKLVHWALDSNGTTNKEDAKNKYISAAEKYYQSKYDTDADLYAIFEGLKKSGNIDAVTNTDLNDIGVILYGDKSQSISPIKSIENSTAYKKGALEGIIPSEKTKYNAADDWAGININAGVSQYGASSWATLDATLGKGLQLLGWKDNPITSANKFVQDRYAYWIDKSNNVALAVGDNNNYGGKIVHGFIGLIPDMALAIATSGGSLHTTSALQKAARVGTSASTVGKFSPITSIAVKSKALADSSANAITTAIKNPMYWTSFVRTFGTDYERAKETLEKQNGGKTNSTDQAVAYLYAIITSSANALVEMSGGIQKLPAKLQNKSQSQILQWVISAVEEGSEEVVQGVISELNEALMYNSENWDNVIDPKRMLEEFAIGTVVGGIAGGGQVLMDNVSNSKYKTIGKVVRSNKVIDEVVKYAKASSNENIRDIATSVKDGKISDKNLGVLYSYVVGNIDAAFNSASDVDGVNRVLQELLSENNSEVINTLVLSRYVNRMETVDPENIEQYKNKADDNVTKQGASAEAQTEGVAEQSAGSGQSVLDLSAKNPEGDPIQRSIDKAIGRKTVDQKALDQLGKTFGLTIKYENLDENRTRTVEKTDENGKTYTVEEQYLFSPEGAINRSTGEITLNSNAKENHRPGAFIVKHEIAHSLEIAQEQHSIMMKEFLASNAFNDWVKSKTNYNTGENFKSQEELFQYIIEYRAERGDDLGKSKGENVDYNARCEAVGDFVGDVLFGGRESLGSLVNELSPKTVTSFKEWILNLFVKIKQAFKGKPQLTEIERLEQEFLKVAEQSSKLRRKAAENAVKNKKTTTENGDGVKYSIATDSAGKYVKVDTNQNIFDGKSVREMQEIARKLIRDNFKGKVFNVGEEGKAFVSKRSSDEYSYPANRRMNESLKESKMKAAPELDNLLSVSRFIEHQSDDGRHPQATGGWDVYSTRFEVGGTMFSGEVKIMVTDRGYLFHDITKIKRLPVNGGLTETSSAAASGNPSTDSITENSTPVNSNSMQQGVKYSLSDADTEYMSAVEKGDMETAQRLVDEAAKNSGYRIKGHHGTDVKFTVFNREKTSTSNDFGQGFYFTSSQVEAERYQSDDTFGDTYTKIYGIAEDNAWERIHDMGEDASDDALFTKIFNEEFDKELKRRADEGTVISAYLKMDKPFIVSTSNWITEEEAIDIAKNTMYVDDVPNDAAIADWVHSIKTYAKQHNGKVDTDHFANKMGHAINLTSALLHQGKYDGILDYSIGAKFNSTSDYHAIALYPNKIKDSAPVTYDDNGNVIPLSQRFNNENNDIRYSLPETENAYLELAKDPVKNEAELDKMVEKAAKKAGYTETVYHGTKGFGFTRLDVSKGDDGISFFATDSTDTSGTYSDGAGVRKISEKLRTLTKEDVAEVKKAVNGRVAEFVGLMNDTLGKNDFVDSAQIYSKLEECYDALENGKSGMDVDADFNSFLTDKMFSFFDSYYHKNYQGKMSQDEFFESKEFDELAEKYYLLKDDILNALQPLDRTATLGTYKMFANTGNFLVIDCEGSMWDAITSADLPDINSFKYKKYARYGKSKKWTTRSVVKYAKNKGYDGVTFKNVIDSGNSKNVSPATVYAFFKPQEQVKSADPVTYDDNGNVIPLSERFNRKNDDMRYSVPVASPEELLDQFKRGEITEKEVIEGIKNSKNRPMNPVEIANLTKKSADTTPKLEEPTKSGKGDGVSKLHESLQKGQIITDEIREEIKNNTYIKNYGTTTNAEELNEAAARLDKGGKEEVDEWEMRVNNKNSNLTAVDVAEGIILLKRYQDAGDISGAIKIAEDLKNIATVAGQIVQAFSIIGRFTPDMMVAYAKRELDKAWEILVESKTQEWIDANKSRFELTNDEIRMIRNNTILASQLQDGSRAKAVLLGEITSLLENKLPPQKGDALKTWMRISLLFNVKTQLRNILGNASMVGVYVASDLFGNLVDKAVSTKTGVRTTGFDPVTFAKSTVKGVKKGVNETFDDFKRRIHTKQEELNRFDNTVSSGKAFNEFHVGVAAKQLNAVARALNEVDRLNSMFLELGDRPFFEAWFMNELNSLMKLNKVDTPTKEMVEQAKQVALQRTWQDENAVTKGAFRLKKALNSLEIGGYGLGDTLLRFVKTPANIAKAMYEFSPVGFASAIKNFKAMSTAIKNDNFTMAMQKEAVRSLSNAVIGTMAYILVYALASAGALDMTGGGDEDKDVSNFEKYILGVPPYSFKLGNVNITYTWNQPLGTVLAVVADVMEDSKENDVDIMKTMGTIGEVFTSQSFLQNLSEAFSKDDILTGTLSAVFSDTSAAIPTLLSQVASLTDPKRRNTYDSSGKWWSSFKTVLNDAIYRIPGLRQLFLPEQVNTLGEEVKNPQFLNPWFAFADPSTQYASSSSEVAQQIYELYQSTGNKAVMPRIAPYNVTVGGKKVNFTIEQRNEIQKDMGKTSAKILSEMFSSSEYSKLSDEEKAKAVTEVYSYAYAKVKTQLSVYDYETLSSIVGKKSNGEPILTEEKYNRLTDKARQILIDEYFFSDDEMKCKGDPVKLANLFIKKAK